MDKWCYFRCLNINGTFICCWHFWQLCEIWACLNSPQCLERDTIRPRSPPKVSRLNVKVLRPFFLTRIGTLSRSKKVGKTPQKSENYFPKPNPPQIGRRLEYRNNLLSPLFIFGVGDAAAARRKKNSFPFWAWKVSFRISFQSKLKIPFLEEMLLFCLEYSSTLKDDWFREKRLP